MFGKKKSKTKKVAKKKAAASSITTPPKGRNAKVKKVAMQLIASPTKKNKSAMLKAIVRSL